MKTIIKSDYFGLGVTDPWEIHGTREKRGARPSEETYSNRIKQINKVCEKVPNDLLFKGILFIYIFLR